MIVVGFARLLNSWRLSEMKLGYAAIRKVGDVASPC
jgi:hypothetical protein